LTKGLPTSTRPYGGDNDLALMQQFLSAAAVASPPQAYYHPGDLAWNQYRNPELDPRSEVRLWQDRNGNLLGFAWLEEPDGVVMQVRPDLRGAGILEEPMLAWASEQLADPGRNPGGEIWTRSLETDRRLVDLLGSLGFGRDPFHALKMHRGLGGPLPETPSPAGWSVREVEGEGEWEDRVEVHREVWPSSRMTLEAYRRMREAPGYVAELDLVAAGPGGALGAYCICWLDEGSKTGLFEPVGTHPAHRGKGLGRAVVLEGLRMLRALGASSALVTSLHDNEAASGLYESVGFRTVDREYLYGKKL
jgi:mycothiol synthase